MRTRERILVAALGATLLAACGRPGPAPSRSADAIEPTIRILDPDGRLLCHPEPPLVLATPPGSLAIPVPRIGLHGDAAVYDATTIPKGSEIVVIAAGCRVERLRLDQPRDVMIQMRRGPRVPLRVRWDGRLPTGATGLSVSLGVSPLDKRMSPAEHEHFRSVGADWMDRDLPASNAGTEIPRADADVVLYVPAAGTYRLIWSVDGPNRRASVRTEDRVEVPEDGLSTAVDATPPASWLAGASAAKPTGSGR